MRIDKPTDALGVAHPVTLIVGQPGICKTSLGYSFTKTLLLEFDGGAHRATNRIGDTASFDSWNDCVDGVSRRFVQAHGYTAITIDTVERCLQLLMLQVLDDDPRCGLRGGGLNPKGWGVLKQRFAAWIAQLRSYGLDILLLAHAKEDRDGDRRIVRPDIPGGSLGEVTKIADFVGYLHMRGAERWLDFTISDRFLGKGGDMLGAVRVPPADHATTFLQELVDNGRAAIAAKSAAGAAVASRVHVFEIDLASAKSAGDYNGVLAKLRKVQGDDPMVYAQARHLLLHASRSAGMRFDVDLQQFVDTGVRPPAPSMAPSVTAAQRSRAASWQPRLLSPLTEEATQ